MRLEPVRPLQPVALPPCLAHAVALACLDCERWRPSVPTGTTRCHVLERDAIHRTGRQAEFAAGAQRLDHGVHLLGRTDDAVHRTGIDTACAADAGALDDHRHATGALGAAIGVERAQRLPGQSRETHHALGSARGTTVDVRLAGGDGLRVAAAVRISATRALCLWQHRIDRVDERQQGLRVGPHPKAHLWCLAMSSWISG